METIYLDRLFVLNFIIDYLILIASARICGIYMRRGRYALAAALGALYAVISLFPEAEILTELPLKLLSGLLLAAVSFHGEKKFLRCTLVFFAVSALFGGALWALSMENDGRLYLPFSFSTLLISFALIYAVMSLIFRRSALSASKRILRVRLQSGGSEVSFFALRDSGNTLFDPISGAGVVIISPSVANGLFGACDWTNAADAALRHSGMRLIPYSAVGTESGLMAAFRPDLLELDGRKRDDLVAAVSPVEISGDGYCAVIPDCL